MTLPSNTRFPHAHVEKLWYSREVAVWLLTYEHVAQNTEHGLIWIPQKEGAKLPEPTYKIPEEMFAAIIEAGTDYIPPSAATDRHLEDSIKVRDRLLTLVEKQS